MATYKDIRVKFAAALNEAKKLPYSQDLSKQVRDLLIKNKIRGNKAVTAICTASVIHQITIQIATAITASPVSETR